jgi:hypothetical protein
MLKSVKTHHLVSALQMLLPGAISEHIERTDWRSATFEGEQIAITLILPGEACSAKISRDNKSESRALNFT